MKTKRILNHAIMAACIAFPAWAADPNAEELRSQRLRPYSDQAGHSNRQDRLGRAEKASDLIGMDIKNYQGEKLGKLDELAVDVESGRVVHAIVSAGGFLGVGDTLIAVPPGALHCDAANKVIHLDANKARLKAAPKFEMSKWAESSNSDRITEVYRYYGQEPYFARRDWNATPGKVRPLDNERGNDRTIDGTESSARVARMGHVGRATKLMGMAVNNLQDEKLGKVENLMVDLQAGRLVAVILSSGGFLGLGDELSAVPPGALRYNGRNDGLVLDATKDSLTKAPHFKTNQWPDLGHPGYAEGVYRAYGIEPYFSTNMTDADNTARNVRDRDGRSVTPLDQGNSTAEIETTARIRKEILALKDISANSRNVKVITSNGRVTLRGPVNTEEEKRRIGEIARRINGTDNVDNQLEVKNDRN